MCNYFSAIITRKGEVLFCELDAHEEIIKRKGLKDDKLKDRDFVRIEITEGKYEVDEVGTLPDWYFKKEKALKRKAFGVFKKVDKYHEEYEKKEAPIWEEYEKKKALIWEEYEKKEALIWEEYEKKKAPIWEEYENKISKIKGFVSMEV